MCAAPSSPRAAAAGERARAPASRTRPRRHAGSGEDAVDAEAGSAGERHFEANWTTTAPPAWRPTPGSAKLWQETDPGPGRHHRRRRQEREPRRRAGTSSTVMFFDEVDHEDQEDASRADDGDRRHDGLRGGEAAGDVYTGPTAQAHLVGTQGDVTAERIRAVPERGEQASSIAPRRMANGDGHRRTSARRPGST